MTYRSHLSWWNYDMCANQIESVSVQQERKMNTSYHVRFTLWDVTDTNQSESHSGLQQLRFSRNYMGAWRTWIRPPTSSLLLDWSCKRTRRRRRLYEISMLRILFVCFDFTMLTFLILSQSMLHHVERHIERIIGET